MAVAFDAVATSPRTGLTDPHSWTHTPSGTPRGVIVAFATRPQTSSDISGITYGGVAMTQVTTAVDTADESGMAEVWFLGSSIPTGAQTVQVDFVSASPTDDYLFISVTVTASKDTEIIDSDVAQENQADPSVTLTYGGKTALTVGALHSGRATTTDITWDSGITSAATADYGGDTGHVAYQTTAGSSDFTFGATVVIDDVAMAAAAVSEVGGVAPIIHHRRMLGMQ